MVSEFISVITWIFCIYGMLLMGDFDTCIVLKCILLKCILIYETENLYFTFILIGIELHFDVRDWEPPLYSHIKIGSWYQIGVLPGIEIHFDNTPNLVYLDWLFPCIKVVSKATLLHQNSCFSFFFHLFLHIQASPSCFHNPWIFALPCTHILAHVILFLLHSSLNVNIDLQFGA